MKTSKFLKLIPLFIPLIFLSCSKLSYLVKQGVGQSSLLRSAKPNELLLSSSKVSSDVKQKIRLIQEYKKWFYDYGAWPQSSIYSKTVMLKKEAVSFLVIRSPKDEIRALEECFPFYGCFPYLGFFDLDDAQEYAQEKQLEKEVTWIRPVYAYSTLGLFTDPILSSFFYYDDVQLAELIFHELFHTIFFVKNNVDLNENLANYFASKMSYEYFKTHAPEKLTQIDEYKKLDEINSLVVEAAHTLGEIYQKNCPCQDDKLSQLQKQFIQDVFLKKVKLFCIKQNISLKNCWPLQKEWNNATFAASMTYEKSAMDLEALHKKQGGNLKDFLAYLQSRWLEFQKLDEKDKKFEEWLFEAK